MVLAIGGRPATRCDRNADVAPDMETHREAVMGRGLVDRPVATGSERLAQTRLHEDLSEFGSAGQPLDLAHRGFGVLRRNADRGSQARLRRSPFRGLPLVHRTADLYCEIGIAL